MLVQTKKLLEILGINEIVDLENTLENMAPSMADYFIGDAVARSSEQAHIPNRNIQTISTFGKYQIITDYEGNIYVEENCCHEQEEALF